MRRKQLLALAGCLAIVCASVAEAGPFARLHRARVMRMYGYGPGVHVSAPGVNVNVGAPAPMYYAPPPVLYRGGVPLMQNQVAPQQQQFAGGGTTTVGRNVYRVALVPAAQARCQREAQIIAAQGRRYPMPGRGGRGHPLGIDPSTGARVGGTGCGMSPKCEVCEPGGNPGRWIVIGDASVRGNDGRWYRSVAYAPAGGRRLRG